ncbi:DUF3795 domain-containing protein [Chloroflexota bacterium]
MREMKLTACCGGYCGDCEALGEKCPGCGQVYGKPFHVELYKLEVCQIYGCCVDKKQLENCGLCDEFPCETFTSLRDPSMSDEEFEQSLRERQRALLLRKEIGTEAWLSEKL